MAAAWAWEADFEIDSEVEGEDADFAPQDASPGVQAFARMPPAPAVVLLGPLQALLPLEASSLGASSEAGEPAPAGSEATESWPRVGTTPTGTSLWSSVGTTPVGTSAWSQAGATAAGTSAGSEAAIEEWTWSMADLEAQLDAWGWTQPSAKQILGHPLGEIRLPEAKVQDAPAANRAAPAAQAAKQENWQDALPMPRVSVIGSNWGPRRRKSSTEDLLDMAAHIHLFLELGTRSILDDMKERGWSSWQYEENGAAAAWLASSFVLRGAWRHKMSTESGKYAGAAVVVHLQALRPGFSDMVVGSAHADHTEMKKKDNCVFALKHLRDFLHLHRVDLLYIDANSAAHAAYFPSLAPASALGHVFTAEDGWLQPAPAALRPLFGHSAEMVREHGNCTGFLVHRRLLMGATVWEHGQWRSLPADRPQFKEGDITWHPASFLRLSSLTVSTGTRIRSAEAKARRREKYKATSAAPAATDRKGGAHKRGWDSWWSTWSWQDWKLPTVQEEEPAPAEQDREWNWQPEPEQQEVSSTTAVWPSWEEASRTCGSSSAAAGPEPKAARRQMAPAAPKHAPSDMKFERCDYMGRVCVSSTRERSYLRIGEAKNPGPDSPSLPSIQATQLDSPSQPLDSSDPPRRLRLRGKSQPPPEEQTEDHEPERAPASGSVASVSDALLGQNIGIVYENREVSTLTCASLAKNMFRWQAARTESHRRHASSDRPTRLSALQSWLSAHGNKLEEQARQALEDVLRRAQATCFQGAEPPATQQAVAAPAASTDPQSQDSVTETTENTEPQPPLAHDQVESLMAKRIKVLRHPPAACRAAWAQIIQELAQKDNVTLLVAPKLVLNMPAQNLNPKRREKRVLDALKLAASSQWQTLFRQAMDLPTLPYPQHVNEEHLDGNDMLTEGEAQRILKLAHTGQHSKGWKELNSLGVADPTPHNFDEAMLKLRTCGAGEPQVPHAQARQSQWNPDIKAWEEAVGRLKPRKAADAGGWTAELFTLCWEDKAPREVLQAWLTRNMGPRGPPELKQCCEVTCLVMLRKHGGGVRPILLVNFFRKILNSMLARQSRDALQRITGHIQYGHSSQGPLLMLGAIESHRRLHANHCVVQLDIRNAFGAIDRSAALRLLWDKLDTNARDTWLPWIIDSLSAALAVMAPHDPTIVERTWDGLPQGDPLSAIIFSAVMALQLQEWSAPAEGTILKACYVDDTIIGVHPTQLAEAMISLKNHFQSIGLTIQPAKTRIWADPHLRGQNLLQDAIAEAHLPIEVLREGITICGQAFGDDSLQESPFGDTGFIQEWLRKIQEQLQQRLRKLLSLPRVAADSAPSIQVTALLLRAMWPGAVVHLLRSLPTHITQAWAEELDGMFVTAFKELMQIEALTPHHRAILSLPVPTGGFALPKFQSLAKCARLAAITTLPAHPAVEQYKQACLETESLQLIDRINDATGAAIQNIVGNDGQGVPGRSLRGTAEEAG